MDYIGMLRGDHDLSDLLCDVCDIEVFPEDKTPEDEGGHLAYNIPGKTFAGAGIYTAGGRFNRFLGK